MCGIIGYVGHRPAVPLIMEGLSRLEYRGYDSAGVAWLSNGRIDMARATGKLGALRDKLAKMPSITATCAMGHTRWATHGAPEERNAHPHLDNNRTVAIVHNGIIENYQQLKSRLLAEGYKFYSDTDTEVLVNLVAWHLDREADLLRAFAAALREARGAYAVCLLDVNQPDTIYGARMSAPLILGAGVGENFIASDIPAFLPYTRQVVFLEDGEIVAATPSRHEIYRLSDLSPVKRETNLVQWDIQAAQKDGYRHFMIKEIFEQPRVVRDGLAGKYNPANRQISMPELDSHPVPANIRIVACGTSYHSGLWARHLFEDWAKIPCQVEIASEFRYRNEILLDGQDIAIFISQSGETADTLAALRLARQHNALTLGLCNVIGSTIAREADIAVFTQAGPEISVASTKAMCSQMLALTLMALYWAVRKNLMDKDKLAGIMSTLYDLPRFLDDNLPEMRKRAKELASRYSGFGNFFYLGRGAAYPMALEGALKLKELSYIHAEGYAAGEMKHGPIALIDPNFPTFAIALDNRLYEKVKSNIAEIKARNGKVIALCNPGCDLAVSDTWIIPPFPEPLAGFAVLPALQLFSYEVADYLGKDVDQPRNLAKSVTVE